MKQEIRSERIRESYQKMDHPSGLTLLLYPMEGFSSAYAMLTTDYGSVDMAFRTDPKADFTRIPAGTAHFLEHKMFENEDGDAFAKYAATGASANAFTSFDKTSYLFGCADHFEESLRILLEFVTTPYFTPQTVNKEQGIIGQEIQMIEDNPDWRMYQNLLRALYQNHPIRIPLAGSRASIAEITADTLYQCHDAFYHPGNMVLCVVGDVDPEQVAAIARSVLPEERRSRTEKDLGTPEPELPAQSRIVEEMEVSSPNFLLGFKAKPHPNGEEDLRLQLLGDLAGEILVGESSPLYARLYGEGLIDKSFFVSYESDPGAAFLVMGGESRQLDQVTEAILAEGARLRQEKLDPDLFRRCKKAAYGSRVRALNSMDHVGTRLADGKLKGYHYYRFADLYDTIAPEDVQAFLDGLIRREYAALSVVQPKGMQIP